MRRLALLLALCQPLGAQSLRELGDQNAPIIDAVVGQLLGFFRCLDEGLPPDSPSEDGIINRVVQSFTLHQPRG